MAELMKPIEIKKMTDFNGWGFGIQTMRYTYPNKCKKFSTVNRGRHGGSSTKYEYYNGNDEALTKEDYEIYIKEEK